MSWERKHYRVVESRTWTDPYPDTFRVGVETSNESGEAFVVVSGEAVWLNPDQTREAAEYMLHCAKACEDLNKP